MLSTCAQTGAHAPETKHGSPSYAADTFTGVSNSFMDALQD